MHIYTHMRIHMHIHTHAHKQAHSPEFSEKVKSERFKLHNCQWLEMVTGKSVYEDDYEKDEDYMDPYYLHMATELYSPEYFNDGGTLSPNKGALAGQDGRRTPVPPPHPPYTSPVVMDYIENERLMEEEYSSFTYGDNQEDWYGNMQLTNELEVPDYTDHPAFAVVQGVPKPDVLTARPPSRLKF